MLPFPELSQFRALARELRPGTSACPFVVDAKLNETVSLLHYDGGRDATYVVVSRPRGDKTSQHDDSFTIRYAPFVEGTTIIYDARAETMQGKARPFVCHLNAHATRVYAVMPFQIEEILVRSKREKLSVDFLDGRSERVAAALPFELRLFDTAGTLLSCEYHSTDREGRFSSDAARASRAVVRSLITGGEESFTLEPRSALRD